MSRVFFWDRRLLKPVFDSMNMSGPRKIDKWGGGHIFIYSDCPSLISFEIDCFYSL